MNVRVALAWLVHAYTAFGLVCAFMALRAISEDRPLEVFLWLALAFAIDCSDGVLARRARVDVHTPNFSGRLLDDIIDYINYTLIPVWFIYHQGLLSEPWLPLLGFTLIASAYGFCSSAAKTADGFFTGFPSYWNVVAFYLYFISPPEWLAAAVVAGLALMTFWPVLYLYPSKNRQAQWISIGGGIAWALVCLWFVLDGQPPREWVIASLLYPAWYFGYSFYLYLRPPPAPA